MEDKPNADEHTIQEKDSMSYRVGKRIRKVRQALDLKQSELGHEVGLSADRIQKYENGVRKPKDEMLEKIAVALGVESSSLTDPSLTDELSVLFALFELEDQYKLKVKKISGRNVLEFGNGRDGTINSYIDVWTKKKEKLDRQLKKKNISEDEQKRIKKEYELWKLRFPQSVIDEREKLKAEREEKIRLLKEAIQETNTEEIPTK